MESIPCHKCIDLSGTRRSCRRTRFPFDALREKGLCARCSRVKGFLVVRQGTLSFFNNQGSAGFFGGRRQEHLGWLLREGNDVVRRREVSFVSRFIHHLPAF